LLPRRGDAGAVAYKTSDTDPVSEADRASERLITESLLAARPDDGLLGEEGVDIAGTTGLRWVVDPLDGTVNFLYGMPAWSVSIACADEHGSVIGVVHQPTTGLTYTAIRDGGSYCNGRHLSVNDPVPLARALIATGFAYDVENRTRQAKTIAALLPQVRDIRRVGSAALDLCMLGAGMVDGYFEDTTSHWDWAAGALVASEAGAAVQVLGNGIVAAGPALFAELVDVLETSAELVGDP
jgi:myo-inositol-1(or 4)-monophosphatase